MISSTDTFMPKVRLLSFQLIEVLHMYFPDYLPLQEYYGPGNYHNPEVIVCAFKTYRLLNLDKANPVPNLTDVLERLEKECKKGAKKMMKDLGSIDLEIFKFPDTGRGYMFSNCYLALLLHMDAKISITNEGLINRTGDPCEGRLLRFESYSDGGLTFDFTTKSRRLVSMKLQRRDLLDLSSLGIVFQDQISIDLSKMDKPTLYELVGKSATMERKHSEERVEEECGVKHSEERVMEEECEE